MKSAAKGNLNDVVYHFTDTMRLPWIIETGQLQPYKNGIGGFPADPLWVTIYNVGDRTSTAFAPSARQAYHKHLTQLVRITLRASDFMPWRQTLAADPAWTRDDIRRLRQTARKLGQCNTEGWRCRSTALPLSRAVEFHAKADAGGGWEKIDATCEYCIHTGIAGQRGFVIGDYAYFATKTVNAIGLTGYDDLQRVSRA